MTINTGQKYCRMLVEHSAVFLTSIKLSLLCLFLSGRLRQVSLYLNIPECFQHNHLSNLLNIEGINKVSIEGVEVGFNTGPLHDEILGHPLRVLLFHFLL